MENSENSRGKEVKLNTIENLNTKESIFQRTLEAKNLPKETISLYLAVVRKFTGFIGSKDAYSKADVILFLSEQRRLGKKGATLRFYFSTLKRFFKSLNFAWEFDVGDAPKIEEQYQPMFEDQEIEAMEKVAEKRGLRDLAIVRLSHILGPRRVELSKMDRADYRKPEIFIKTAKHGNPVWNYMDEKTCAVLDAYLATRRDRNPAMFVRGRGKSRLSTRQLSDILKRIREEAGINKSRAGFHAARRKQVTDMDMRGATPKEITIYKGWKDDKTVLRYTKPKPEQVKEKMLQITTERSQLGG